MCACIARSFNCCTNWLLYAVLTRTNFKRHDIKPNTDVEPPKRLPDTAPTHFGMPPTHSFFFFFCEMRAAKPLNCSTFYALMPS